MARKHVVITGTGRAGTSFLIQLLTNLGLETGFTADNMHLDENSRAGLERDLRKDGAPYIVKTPGFCEWGAEVRNRDDIVIEHIFIPMRDLYEAAQSRRCVLDSAVSKLPWAHWLWSKIKPPGVPGGLWLTKNKRKQEEMLLQQLYKLFLILAGTHIPVTLLEYPRLAKDSAYLFQKLQPILGGNTSQEFSLAFDRTVRPEWIHHYLGQRPQSDFIPT